MSTDDTQFAWWSRLRHSGLLLSPVVQIEKYSEQPEEPKWYQPEKLRTAYNRFLASIDRSKDRPQLAQGDILTWVDSLLEKYVGYSDERLARSHSIPESLTAVIRIGSLTETLRPDRVLFDDDGKTPLLLVKADTSPHIGRGKGRTEYARFLELLRGCGHRLGLLTNGLQYRLIYAGLDFESWCEWESERWFEDTEGTEELLGLRQMLFPTQITDNKGEVVGAGLPGLLPAIEESRKRQADLSQVLRENVRQAVELLLEDVSTASRTDADLFNVLVSPPSESDTAGDKKLSDAQAQEALLQATVRVVMRMVVCLFAESRGLLPVNDLIYSQAYGVRTLYELLDETVRHEGSQLGLMSRQSAWPRLMALFRLIHGGSSHGGFPLRPYGGALFRPGESDAGDAVARALFILEHKVTVNDATIFRVLRKLLRGPLPVLRGRSKTYVEGPVDYTELRTEFIGLIYEGLLDYRLKRTDEETGPQVFLKLGRQPVLPLSRLESMLQDDPDSLKDLFAKLKKESVSATVESDEENDEDVVESEDEAEQSEEITVEAEAEEGTDQSYIDAVQAARSWARDAIVETGLVGKQRKKETDTEYNKRIEEAIDDLIDRVVAPGEFYLVRAGNTRKGTGTFYTRPQLAVPTVHRTLEPLCYDKGENGALIPKEPEEILGIKVCDPACGSASFLVAALHYLTDALYKSLCYHCGLDDPARAAKLTLPFGEPATGKDTDTTVPLPPDDPIRGEEFSERVQALLRRHVVERCIYGVDINPLAIEFARVSLWVETLDPELPFSFLDHKIKVGNALIGCWLDRFEHYPIKAWERNGGDDPSSTKKGPRTELLETWLKGDKGTNGRRSGDGIIKQEMREAIDQTAFGYRNLFGEESEGLADLIAALRREYEALHDLSIKVQPEEREMHYIESVLAHPVLNRLRHAMNEWCSVWFWSLDEEEIDHIPTPLSFHRPDATKDSIVSRIATRLNFFHWEIEFPDVFTVERTGFDSVLGNPPWETFQKESKEFFSDFDPVYRTYEKQAALAKQEELFASDPNIKVTWDRYSGDFAALTHWIKEVGDPFSVSLARGKEQKRLEKGWQRRRHESIGYTDSRHPFWMQGTGKAYSYKTFLECGFHLLANNGRLGFIVPSGLYTDNGTQAFREFLLDEASWDWLFSFENRQKVFEIDSRFKFASTIIGRIRESIARPLQVAFMVHDVGAWERPDPPVFDFDRNLIPLFSPKSKSIPEVRTKRDLEICETIYSNSIRIGDNVPGWEITYSQEFNMTSDSRHFPTLEKWQKKGYVADEFGRWVADGDIAIPLYEGRMIGQFDQSEKGWVSGRGRSAVWRQIPFDNKTYEPQYLVSQDKYRNWSKAQHGIKLGFMDITSATNTRTFICAVLDDMPCGNKVPTLALKNRSLLRTLALTGYCNSLSFDFVTRNRIGGVTLNWFIVEELPIPQLLDSDIRMRRIAIHALALTGLHRLYAPMWLAFQGITEASDTEWKNQWSVTETDRLRRKVELSSLVADSFGLSVEEHDWIVRDDPTDPKGLWRVDKELPFEERLTGLSAKAFRALKDGKWSAETVGQLSNDEFFDLLGIPELTNAEAAKAKGHSGPLILKRDGCHSWHPENFPKDDPRHGWTWDDCRKDAITLLGSEEALEEYITQATSTGEDDEGGDEEPDPNYSGPKDLFGNPIETDLFGNEIRPKKKRRR